MYTNIQQAVASVENAFPSIYTKDDVVKLLNSIEIESPKESVSLTQSQIDELCRLIVDQVKDNAENLDSEIVDKDTAEFSINSNYLELDSVDIDTSEIARNVVDGIGDVIETFFEDLKDDRE